MAKSYYKTIKGIRYDRHMIEVAEEAVSGQGDGRISMDDAQKLFESIIDGNRVTEVENRTLEYLRENFRFTKPADEWLTQELEKWWLEKGISPDKFGKKEKPETTSIEHLSKVQEKDTDSSQVSSEPVKRSPAVSADQTVIKDVYQGQETAGNKSKASALKFIIPIFLLIAIIAFYILRPGAVIKEASLVDLEPKPEVSDQEVNKSLVESKEPKSQPQTKVPETAPIESPPDYRTLIIQTLEEDLGDRLLANQVQFDKETLMLMFHSPVSHYKSGSSNMDLDLKNVLTSVFPGLVEILVTFDQAKIEIIFHGHSSSKWIGAKNQDEAYQKNLKLSEVRANTTLEYCRGLPEMDKYSEWLAGQLKSVGHSSSKPVMSDDGKEDQDRSRRITLSIGVNERK